MCWSWPVIQSHVLCACDRVPILFESHEVRIVENLIQFGRAKLDIISGLVGDVQNQLAETFPRCGTIIPKGQMKSG